MINAIEWFKEKGFTFDDKITIKDVLYLQTDAKYDGIEVATDLYQAACALMRNQKDANCWHNLQNAAARWNAANQAANNDRIQNITKGR